MDNINTSSFCKSVCRFFVEFDRKLHDVLSKLREKINFLFCAFKQTHDEKNSFSIGLNTVLILKNENDVIKINKTVEKLFGLVDTKDKLSETVPDKTIERVCCHPDERVKFKKTLAFIEENQDAFNELIRDGASFQIKNNRERLGILVANQTVTILTKKELEKVRGKE